jgi:hypothetical protein
MNKRIKELNLQALSEVLNGADPDRDIARMYIPAEFTKKFAELIVRECADVLDKQIAPPNHPMNSLGYKLKEHFGAEK